MDTIKFMKHKPNILVSKGQVEKPKQEVYSSSHALTRTTPPTGNRSDWCAVKT